MARVTLPASGNYYELILEGTLGYMAVSLAIDDLVLISGQTCDKVTSPPPLTTTKQATIVNGWVSCDFEADMCGWTSPSARKWTRHNGQNSIYNTAPLNDVTTHSALGHFAHVNTTYSGSAEKAVLLSPLFTSTYSLNESCLEFWYQMGGTVSTEFTISMANSYLGSSVLWSRRGNKADHWSHAYLRLPKYPMEKQVEFATNITQRSTGGFIAVDDIKYLLSACPTNLFCDFESSTVCEYRNDINTGVKWKQLAGKANTIGPRADHTYQTAEGYYMMIAEDIYDHNKSESYRTTYYFEWSFC